MPRFVVGIGTWLNTATVTAGSLLGMAIGERLPATLQGTVTAGMGLVTLGLGVKFFLGSRNVLIVAAAIALGAIVGTLLHLQEGLASVGDWWRGVLGGGSSTFTEGFVTASILFCVGPMTLLGCLQEALEKKFDLIAVKSTLDGFMAMFLTVALGQGVLLSAAVVFFLQGGLTLLGSRLSAVAKNEELMAEATAVGGPMMLAIGLGLLELKDIPTANFLPALAVAPLLALAVQRWRRTSDPTQS